MKVILKYFGKLKDITGRAEEGLENVETLLDVKEKIYEKYPSFKNESFVLSHNLELKSDEEDALLNEGDEIAFLPPFSGG